MMVQDQSEWIQALKQPFAVAGQVMLLFSLLICLWARFRTNGRAKQTSRMALVAVAFSVVVIAMTTYQSVKQIESDKEYRSLHAIYVIHASIKGTVKATTLSEPIPFTVSSGQLNVGCNDGQSTNVIWSIPDGATEVQATANWENTDNIRSQSQNVSKSPTTVTATGSISGREKDFFGNCPGGGHGQLVLRGTYRIARNESRAQQTLKTLEDKLNKGQPYVIGIPRDPDVIPESCDITIEEGNRRETVHIDLQVTPGNALSIRQQHVAGDIPVSTTLDQDRIIVVVL
jgi:hypothetical protein